ncbi:MAG: hypothetical protein NTV21_01095 [Planctomycetota bacterium]|nr:hypothetical protein [Planctomycetota bacterium]
MAWGEVSASELDAKPASGPPHLWVADRDAGVLVGYDRDLLEVLRIAQDHPVELAVRVDRGLWVVNAGEGGSTGPHVLRRLDADGKLGCEVALEAVLDLETLEGRDALVVELRPGGARRVLRVADDGAIATVETSLDAFCVAGRRGQVLVGGQSGELRLHGPGPTDLRERSFGGLIGDLAAGPEDGSWWVLDCQGGPNAHRLALLGRDLASRWQVSAGIAALHLAEVPGAEQVWLCDASGSFARRFGPGGVRELSYVPLPLVGADRGAARADGSVLFAAPGALVHLDAKGAPVPGQGGLEFAVDLEFVRWP